jgi:hypothetical protein
MKRLIKEIFCYLQSVAFDFVEDENSNPLIVEISLDMPTYLRQKVKRHF